MKGDFSRDTFDISSHFSRVLLQQGRVQLDADWNEQTAILLHYLHTLAADIIGPFAGPAGEALGYKVKKLEATNPPDFSIGKGRYYVDGILCENDKEHLTYTTQTDYPNPGEFTTDKGYLVYLDVWERHITALEDDYIREKALGGPDTASRAKVVCQIRVESEIPTGRSRHQGDIVKPDNWFQWIDLWQPKHRGCLQACVKQPNKANDPCLSAPEAKYRGPENQLYRVEVHAEGKVGTATFKWSRDNGSVVAGCTKRGSELTVDDPRGFAAPGWVELINDGLELRGQPGAMVKVVNVEGDVLTLGSDPDRPSELPKKEPWPTKVRRWESVDILVKEGANESDWITLEYGIQIRFRPAGGDNHHYYRTGDYWLIPARVATGDIEWPPELNAGGTPVMKDGQTVPRLQPPHGIHHHYAPLAILTANGVTDLRCQFHPLNNNCGLSYSYGEEGIGGHLLCDPPKS
jgi:hypothetical protein